MDCVCCGAPHTKNSGQWWSLNNYFGLSGRFCPICYDKVSHDAYGMPRHPEEYFRVLERQDELSHPRLAR